MKPPGNDRDMESFLRVCSALCFGVMISCAGGTSREESNKFKQYFNQGELLYEKNCSNCHQKGGEGLARLYPPLKNSDYLKNHLNESICIIRYGKKGQIIVNGKEFNQPMPPIPTLTDLEIAEIATYIYNAWDQKKGLIPVHEVSALLEKCSDTE